MQRTIYLLILAFVFVLGCEPKEAEGQNTVKIGNEVLLEDHLSELEGKRVGVLMNHTSRIGDTHMVDTLLSRGVEVTAIFAAEHGFRGQAGAGEYVEDGIDTETGLPVHSLYGSTRKPTTEMLDDVDVILFDLPDMGVRFYTYYSTMGLVMEAVAEHDKELWVLDRPNPLGGEYVAGWILQEEFSSFVGPYPLPIAYGMTIGELAKMIIGEGWLETDSTPNLKVIEMKGWEREMKWPKTGREWMPPSPNLPSFEHAFAYPGTVIFEGTNLSEGRGTSDPFLQIGSPNLKFKASKLKPIAEKHHVKLDSVTFTPQSIPGVAASPKHEDEVCTGIRISFEGDYSKTDPIELGLDLLEFAKSHTEGFEILPFANNLYGIDLKSIIENGGVIPGWEDEVKAFKARRALYLIY